MADPPPGRGIVPDDIHEQFLFGVRDSCSIVTGGDTSGERPYCPVRCVFCMCDGDAPTVVSKLPYITERQFDAALEQLDPDATGMISIGDGLTNFVAEPFAHPRIYEMIDRLCRDLPRREIAIISTGILAIPERLERLAAHPNLVLSVSVNTLQERWRARIFHRPQHEKIRRVLTALPRTRVQLMNMDGLLTALHDLDEVDRIAASRGAPFENIRIRRIEHSRYHAKAVRELSEQSIATYPSVVRHLGQQRLDVNYWFSDLSLAMHTPHLLGDLLTHLGRARRYLAERPHERIGLCLAESAYAMWRRWLSDVDNAVCIACPNRTYGGSISVAGLLCFSDVEHALSAAPALDIDRLAISEIMINSRDADIQGVDVRAFAERIGRPVDIV